MKPSILHIVLSLLLLLSYGVERLLPCNGPWDLDCADEQHEQHEMATVRATPGMPGPLNGSVQAPDTHQDSDSPADHNDHQCNCPCHAAAIAAVNTPVTVAVERPAHLSDYNPQLLHTALSPPDHIPIG